MCMYKSSLTTSDGKNTNYSHLSKNVATIVIKAKLKIKYASKISYLVKNDLCTI